MYNVNLTVALTLLLTHCELFCTPCSLINSLIVSNNEQCKLSAQHKQLGSKVSYAKKLCRIWFVDHSLSADQIFEVHNPPCGCLGLVRFNVPLDT